MPSPPPERIAVGLVRGLHGLRGAVRVEVLSDDPERFAVGSVMFVEGDDQRLTVAWSQPSKPGILVRFEEAPTRESVEPLRDRYLEAVPREPLPEGTWYWHQIEGLDVSTGDGEHLGSVAEVMRVGDAEVYVVRGGPRGEIMVPAVGAIVTELDPTSGRLVVDQVALDLPSEIPPSRSSRSPRPPRPSRREHRRRGGRAGPDTAASERAGEVRDSDDGEPSGGPPSADETTTGDGATA